MATTQDFASFIQDRFSGLKDMTFRRMFGEYCIYYHGHIIGFLADNRLLFQDVPTARRLMPEAKAVQLFPGSKDFLIPEDVDNGRFLCEVAEAICEECPVPKPRKSSKSRRCPAKKVAPSPKTASLISETGTELDPEIADFLDFHKNR